MDVLFPLVRAVTVEQPRSGVIGTVSRGAVDSSGNIYIADMSQRNVKSWDREGRFRGVYGRSGAGPGEYRAPAAVVIAPGDGAVVVTDPVGTRYIAYDRATFRVRETTSLKATPRPTVVLPTRSQGLFVVGTGTGLDTIYDVQYLEAGGLQRRHLVRRPADLRGPLAGAVLLVSGDQLDSTVVVVRNLDGILYRISSGGELKDSLVLPRNLYPGITLPKEVPGRGNPMAIRDWMQGHPWVTGVRMITDTQLLVGISRWDTNVGEWNRQYLLVEWHKRVQLIAPCQCTYLGESTDTLVFLHGQAPGPFRIEYRLLEVVVQ